MHGPESTVWELALTTAQREKLPLIEDPTVESGIYYVMPRCGVYVHPRAKHITLRQNTADYVPFDPTVKVKGKG